MPTEQQEREYQDAKENGRLGTPDRDTSAQVTDSFTLKEVWFLLPTIASVIGTSLLLYIGGVSMWIVLIALSICAVTSMFGITLVIASHEYNDPTEIIAGWVSYAWNRIRLPLTDPFAALLRIHGIKRPFVNGTVEMADGSLLCLRRMTGRTTQNISQEEFDRLAASFGSNIDEGIKDIPFKFVSQTRPEDIEDVTGPLEDVAYSGVLDRMKGYLGEYARAKHEWYLDVDAPANDAREMCDYIVVKVRPKDIPSHRVSDDDGDAPDDTSDAGTGRIRGVIRGFLPYSKFMPFDILGTSAGNPSFAERKEIQSELHRRLRKVDQHLMAGVDGCEVEKVSVEETVAVLLAYWTGRHHDPDAEFEQWFNRDRAEDIPTVWPHERLYAQGEREAGVSDPENVPGSEAARQALRTAVPDADESERPDGSDLAMTPSHFDQKAGYMEIGNQYVSGFWICDHATAVKGGFAKALYQLDGIDYTITWDVTPVEKEAAIEDAWQGEVNSGAKRGNESEKGGRQLVGDERLYKDIQDRLENTSAQAWDITGYVVLRAGPREAVEFANREENEHKEFEPNEAKYEALLDAEDELRSIVEGSSINGALVKPQRWQKEILESASPNKENVYNEALRKKAPGRIGRSIDILLGDEETSGPKQRRVLGGWLGALFPPSQATINEEGGFRWGRDTETGLMFSTNPAKRHTGGHMVTAGVTRSGKTYGASKTAVEWYTEAFLSQLAAYVNERPNRVFIAADTEKGFLGPCKLVGGTHIPISGDTRLNPFDGRPPSNPHEEEDPYRMGVDFVTEFVKRILRAQDVDASRYHTIIERGVEANYEQAGMATGRFVPDDDKEMPDMPGALEIWKDIQEDGSAYSHSAGDSREADRKEQKAGELLDYLSGFREGGKYENLMGQTTFSMESDGDGPEFYYIDMFGLTSSNDAEKSAMLWLAQNFATQKSRESNDEMVFLGDEAHLMLYSDEQVELILRWLREWARNNSWVWLISQNLSEFMTENSALSGGKKQAMWDQFAQKQIYNYPTSDEQTLRSLLPNEGMVADAQDDLTSALAEQGFAECYMMVEDNDKPGWHRVLVEACPLMDHALNYDPKADYTFDEYMQYFLHTDALAPVERLFASDEELEKEPEITDRGGLANLYAQQGRMNVEADGGETNGTNGTNETREMTETIDQGADD